MSSSDRLRSSSPLARPTLGLLTENCFQFRIGSNPTARPHPPRRWSPSPVVLEPVQPGLAGPAEGVCGHVQPVLGRVLGEELLLFATAVPPPELDLVDLVHPRGDLRLRGARIPPHREELLVHQLGDLQVRIENVFKLAQAPAHGEVPEDFVQELGLLLRREHLAVVQLELVVLVQQDFPEPVLHVKPLEALQRQRERES
mmetsp:Transcript_10675/g.37909  ORF Transcript_10675/g.37909 Transcript_10675/m.37909 type:complete len:200 (-) Transcript_10675:42-641(-)